MRRNKSILTVLAICALTLLPLTFRGAAQEQKTAEVAILEARFSTTAPTVGEPFKYFLKFDANDGVKVFPVAHFTENQVTIVEQKALAPQQFQGRVIQQYEYTLNAMQAGQRQFRPVSINYAGPRQTPTAAETEAVQLTVTGMMDVQIVTNSPVMLNEKLELSLSVTKRKPVTLTAMPPVLEARQQLPAPPGRKTIGEQIEAAQARKMTPATAPTPGAPPGSPTPQAPGTPTPTPTPSILQFELDQTQKIAPQQAADEATVEQYKYVLAAPPQQAGEYVIPAVTVAYRTAGGEEAQVTTAAASIFVMNPNTGNLAVPTDYRFLILPAIGLVIMLLTGLAVWLFLKYRTPRRRANVPAAPPLPPGERAHRELAQIRTLKLPVKGEFKQYYTLVSEAVRKFLGAEFGFPVLERTTEEVLADIRQRDVPDYVRQRTGQFLQDADLVKFAKSIPLLAEADSAMAQAVKIVDESVAYHQPQIALQDVNAPVMQSPEVKG